MIRVVEIQKSAVMRAKETNSHKALKQILRRHNDGKSLMPNGCLSVSTVSWRWRPGSLPMRKHVSTVWVEQPQQEGQIQFEGIRMDDDRLQPRGG